MLKNYLKATWRHLLKNKTHTFINMAGLSVGFTCAILIMLWIESEVKTNAFHVNTKRLYAVYERQYFDNKVRGQYSTPGVLAEEMKKMLPNVQYATNAAFASEDVFRTGNKMIRMRGGAAGADFFKMFSYPIIEGNAQTALKGLSSIAISRKMAEDFYGSPQQAIGKTIRYNNQRDFTIAAVFENVGDNSTQRFDYLVNWPAFQEFNPGTKSWQSNWPLTYIMLRQGVNAALFKNKIAHFMDNYVTNQKKGVFTVELGMQPFADTYLQGHFEEDGNPRGGLIELVRLFGIIAAFILLIACINFMNLATARSVKRAREIGVRKVVGAARGPLIRQFLGESLFITFLAASLSILLLVLFLPFFNNLIQKQIGLPFNQIDFWVKVVLITIVTGLVSGSYPALFLSSFNPVSVLKGTFKLGNGSAIFRKSLVTFQFALSALIITATIIITKQIDFIKNKNSGFDRVSLIYIPAEGKLSSAGYDVFKTEAANMPGIQSVSFTNSTPTLIDNGTEGVSWTGKNPNQQIRFVQTGVGYDFVKTLGLKLINGRDFSGDFPTDSANYILNETAVKQTGYADPIGQSFSLWGQKGKIIGVLKDFNINSLHEPIRPLAIWLDNKKQYGSILVRTQPGQTSKAMASLKSLCRVLNPEVPFSYTFADEEYQSMYQGEQVLSKLSRSSALLAIFISSLGLLALSMFAAEQRIKEISIRKVLGASVTSLFAILSSEFLRLIVIAIIIAFPLTWYGLHNWLETFAYRTDITWWMFAVSGLSILIIALATVSFQAIKATLVNPLKSLRSE